MAKRKTKAARVESNVSKDTALNLYINYLIPDLSNLKLLEAEYYRGIENPLCFVIPANTKNVSCPYRLCLLVKTSELELKKIIIHNATASKEIDQGQDTIIVAINEFEPLNISNNSESFDVIGGIF